MFLPHSPSDSVDLANRFSSSPICPGALTQNTDFCIGHQRGLGATNETGVEWPGEPPVSLSLEHNARFHFLRSSVHVSFLARTPVSWALPVLHRLFPAFALQDLKSFPWTWAVLNCLYPVTVSPYVPSYCSPSAFATDSLKTMSGRWTQLHMTSLTLVGRGGPQSQVPTPGLPICLGPAHPKA